jgi:hypothetical protein
VPLNTNIAVRKDICALKSLCISTVISCSVPSRLMYHYYSEENLLTVFRGGGGDVNWNCAIAMGSEHRI